MDLPPILITGYAGSGKSTVARMLSELGRKVANVGDLLARRLTDEHALPVSRSDLGPIFLGRYGASEIFQMMKDTFLEDGVTVFDGVRLMQTCQQFLSWKPTVQIWVVDSPGRDREKHLRERFGATGLDAREVDAAIKRATAYDEEEERIRSLPHVLISNTGSVQDLSELVKTHAKV